MPLTPFEKDTNLKLQGFILGVVITVMVDQLTYKTGTRLHTRKITVQVFTLGTMPLQEPQTLLQ